MAQSGKIYTEQERIDAQTMTIKVRGLQHTGFGP